MEEQIRHALARLRDHALKAAEDAQSIRTGQKAPFTLEDLADLSYHLSAAQQSCTDAMYYFRKAN